MRRPPKPEGGGLWHRLAVGVGVVTVLLGIAYVIYQLVSSDTSDRRRVVETVTLKLVPPPPSPPPPKVEPPPPKVVEQQKIQEPVDKPQDKPKDVDKPPPGPLALDAKGGPGTDAFGLGGKLGGQD